MNQGLDLDVLIDDLTESLDRLKRLYPPLDLAKVREIVLGRRFWELGDMPGPVKVKADQVDDLFALLVGLRSESSGSVLDTRRILIDWIDSVSGERASGLLLRALAEELLPDDDDWQDVALMLGRRGHSPAEPFLELAARSGSEERVHYAQAALVLLEEDRHLPGHVDRIREESAGWYESLEVLYSSSCYRADIGPAVPVLQEKFLSSDDPEIRRRVADVLRNYEYVRDAPELRQWMIKHLGEAVDSAGTRYTEHEKSCYKQILRYISN